MKLSVMILHVVDQVENIFWTAPDLSTVQCREQSDRGALFGVSPLNYLKYPNTLIYFRRVQRGPTRTVVSGLYFNDLICPFSMYILRTFWNTGGELSSSEESAITMCSVKRTRLLESPFSS